jgi:hypothetical protein
MLVKKRISINAMTINALLMASQAEFVFFKTGLKLN